MFPTYPTIKENIINEKKINKKEENLKTASQTHDVSNYAELKNALNSTDEDVTININSNITLPASPTLNTNIKTLTINGNSYTINGNNKYRFLNITSNQMVNINNITITNCHAQDLGGAIYNERGNLTINNSNLTQNTATGQNNGYGGAIYNNGGTLTITDSNLTQNNVTGQYGVGGAIFNDYGGNLTITESNLTQNTATGQIEGVGGAIYNTGNLNITQSNLTQNNATGQGQNGYGGAIHNNRGTLNITQSNLTQNTATGQTEDGVGGAIYNWEGTLHINNTNLTQNTATGQNTGRGGAIYNRGNLNITQSNLTQNNATGQTEDGVGGAIYNYVGTLTITQSNLTQNTATGQGYGWGGAIYNNGTLNITHSNLTQNTATGQGQDGYGIGGAIYNNGTLNITHSNLTQNTATGQTYDGYGGAIYNGGTLNITHSNLTQNTATGQTYDGRGGAIYDASWSILTSITSSNFINNTAPYGAAIYADGNVSFTSNTFKENTATNNKETIDLNGYWNGIHEGNNYESTDIALKEIKLNIKDDQTIFQQGDEVVLNYSIQLTTPMNYWDFETGINDITLYINNEKNKTTKYENTTLTDLQPGTYEIYYTTCNRQSNKVTFTVYYPDTECNVTNYTLLVQAIENATNNPYTSYKINLQPGDYNATQSINWENSATRKIIINGNGQTLNGQKTYQFIKIAQEHNLTLTNLTITNYTAEEGGAIYNSGTLKIDNSILEYNNATRGGAIYNNNGEAFIESNYFIANPSQMTETAIINDGTATIENNEGAETSTYNGTIYTNSTYTVTIEDNKFYDKLNTTINISTNNTNPEINDVINITFTLKDLLDRPIIDENITITIKDYTTNKTTDITGTTSIEHTIKSNETLINATYPGNNNYNTNTTTLLVTAPKIETKLIVDDADTKVGQNFTITGTLLDKDNQPLSIETVNISVNGSTKTATTNTMGQFNTTFTLDQMGEYQITVIYPGTDVYNQSTNNTAKVTATKTDTKLTLTVSNDTPVNNTQINITATLTDTTGNKLANQNITIKVSDKTFTVKTNNNGIATQTYTPTKVEKQTITTTYKGDSQYVNSTATTTITVKKINTKLTVKVSNTTPVNSTSITITVTLTDADNNKLANQNVTLNVAGKTFNLITNSNGIATQTYTPTKVEKQTITATYKGDSKYNNSTATTNITVKKINTKLDLKISNTTPVNNTPINITVTLTDADNNKLANQQVTLNINGKSVTAKTNNNGIVTQTYTPTKVETQNITATYKGDSRYNNSTKTIKITVKNKIKTQTTVNSATGVIGEKLTIKATVTDTNGGNVNEGNLIFKVNGVTIKDNGKLTGSNNPLKIKIVNGVATATIIPDINMTNAKNITAYYVGTTIYNASTSSPASINISKRNATIEVTTNKKIIKQGQVLRITAKIYDTTNGKKTSNITKYQDEYVYFKVNGITLKDTNGEMLKVKIVNGTATVNYTIPLGISCVTDMQTLTPKNHTIQVGLYNKNYQNIMTKTPTFQVERSNITINLANATINNKTHTLSMKITIKDYLGNVVAGPNKCIIKVNCVTLKNGTNVQYYYTTDGVLDLKNIPVPQSKNYTSIEVITQDRLAYNSQRNTTKVIKVIN
ncbi:Ig-like domain repeat protein [Methanosphaera sp. BMS]|uniref:beta strand repeat-containing protein n=1 Tax=Methanosphaera sp. BMS TaxID=1789762 RepID=UPI003001A632